MVENQRHIPEGWIEITQIGKFCKVINGLSGKTKDDFGTGKPYIPYVNVFKNSKIDITELDYVKIKEGENQNALQYGDLIFTTSSETIKEVGMTSVFLEKNGVYYLNSFCFILRLNSDDWLIPEFSQYLFRTDSIRHSISLLGQGSTRYNLSKTRLLKELCFILPTDTKEQTQIATILSKVDEAITQTKKLIAKYSRIKTGLMQDLLTKGIDKNGNIRSEETHEFKDSPLGRIPKEWECVNFGEYIELVHGYQFRNYDFTETGTPIVKIGQVKENGLDLSHCSFINPNRTQSFAKQTINNGDVLMALTGATLGKACMVLGLNNPVMQNYRVGRFEPIFENDVDKTFLFFTLKSTLFLAQIFNNVNEAAQGNVGKSDFKKSFFIKPPFEEQSKIVSHIEKVFGLVDDFNLELNKYQSLKTGLMQDLLSGKVRVNNLIKETANV
jgi:type I restriction enzyme S subunit